MPPKKGRVGMREHHFHRSLIVSDHLLTTKIIVFIEVLVCYSRVIADVVFEASASQPLLAEGYKEGIMGTNYENDGSSAASKLTFLLAGAGIGAVIALLFAPKSGVELREDLADATRKGIEKGKETATQLQERAGEYYEATREKAGDLLETAQGK